MEVKGIVFNIQKFSIHDGPGVRTNVFLKGCPLRCKWCSNPESQAYQPQILYRSDECIHCGTCVVSCPQQSISVNDKGKICIDYAKCDGCQICVHKCPKRVLTCEGEEQSVDKVLDAAKTITTIRVRLPENRTTFTKTLFLTEKQYAVKPLFDLTNSES